MTVIEQILAELSGLDEGRQRELLAFARSLRAEPDVSVEGVDFDDEGAADAWRARLAEKAALRVTEAMGRFRTLGLVDEEGRKVEREPPSDMQSGSKTSVAT